MIHLNEYVLKDDIVNLLEELINTKQVISENMISDSDIVKLFESNELNFEQKNKEELEDLFKKISNHKDVETDIIDNINENLINFINTHFKSIKDKIPFKLLADLQQSYRNALLIDSVIIQYPDMNSSSDAYLKIYDAKKYKDQKPLETSSYSFKNSFFANILSLLEKANLLKQVFDGSCDDGYLKLNINDTSKFTLNDAIELAKSSNDKHNEDNNKNTDIKNVEKKVIEDNTDLIKQLLINANTNAEQVTSVINKICKNIKTDESTVLGLTVMICGMLMSLKKNGKGNKIAIKTLAEKIVKITSNKKTGIRNILK